MKTKLLALIFALASYPLVAQTPTAPPQAKAAGFNKLVFDDEFTTQSVTSTYTSAYVTGINWYPFSWAGAKGGLTVTTGTSTIAGQSIVGNFNDTTGQVNTLATYPPGLTANTPVILKGSWRHAYFEARIQTAGEEPTGASGWPAFWLVGTSYFQYGGTPAQWLAGQTTECDIMEWYPFSSTQLYGINTIHNWQHSSGGTMGTDLYNTGNSNVGGKANNFMTALVGTTQAAQPDSNWHTWGCLWTATGPATGQVQFYEDNYLISHSGVTTFATGEGTQLPQMEMENMFILMGPGGAAWPINVDWVHVWQGTQPTTTPQTVAGFESTGSYTATSTVTLPAATAQSLPLTYAVFSGPAKVSGANVTFTGAGTAIVTATQVGNSAYTPLTLFQTMTVTGTVTPPVLLPQTLALPTALSTSQSPYALPAVTSAGLTPTYAVTGPATVATNTLTLTSAGSVLLSATQAGNATYAPLSETGTITVTAPPPTTATVITEANGAPTGTTTVPVGHTATVNTTVNSTVQVQ